jgi:hypothetical protein
MREATDIATNEVLRDVADQAERIRNDAEQRPAFVDPGDEVRQGDVYLTRLAGLPRGLVKVDRPARQLAPGDTQGSRHCLRSLRGVRVYRLAEPGPLDGPVIEAEREWAVDHPEHANFVLPPGVYAVTYQRAFAEELRRVED